MKLLDGQGNLREYVIAHTFFQGDNLSKRGRSNNGVFADQYLKFRLLALGIDFRP